MDFGLYYFMSSSKKPPWLACPNFNLIPESCTNYLLRLEALCLYSSFHDFDPHHIGNMSAGQNHSNFTLNTKLSAPRYDTWCKFR
jgi:hypothetical protein